MLSQLAGPSLADAIFACVVAVTALVAIAASMGRVARAAPGHASPRGA